MRITLLCILAVLMIGFGLAFVAADEKHEHGEENAHEHKDHKHEKDEHDHKDAHDHKHDDHDHAHDEKEDEHKHDHAHDHSDEVKLSPEAIKRNGVKVGMATRRAVAATLTVSGSVAFNADAMAHVSAAVKGRVVQIKVRLGDAVKKGDELIVIESPELGAAQSDFLQRRTAIAVAESAVAPARQAYERAKALYDENRGIALAEVQKRQADSTSAEGQLATAKAALAAAENTLELMGMSDDDVAGLAKAGEISPRFAVRAPIGGSVVERSLTMGELVSPEKDALLVLADLSELWVLADVPEARIDDVRIGATARVSVVTSAEPLTGKVANVPATIGPATRTGRVRIVLPNPDGRVRPGMFARVELETGAGEAGKASSLAVPEDAVQTVEGRTVVFVPVKGEPNTFATRPVKVGRAAGGLVPVLVGLKDGDSVVTAGTFILKAELAKAGATHEH